MLSSNTKELFKIVFLIGLGCFYACIIHILFASKTFAHLSHFPVYSGYSYPELIPLVLGLIVFEVVAIYRWKRKIVLTSAIVWLLNFILFCSLRAAEWPFVSTRATIAGSLLIYFLCIALIGFERFNQGLSLKKEVPYRVAGLGSLFLSFIVSTRLAESLLVNSRLPLDKSYLSFNRHRLRNTATCRPLPNTIYAENRSKTLIIVLDAFPIEELFISIAGQRSRVHSFLKSKSDIYKVSYTSIPYTPSSLAYLLAGIEPELRCTYPQIAGSHSIRLAFGSQYFQTAGTVCNPDMLRVATYIRELPYHISSRLGNNSLQNPRQIRVQKCSLMNLDKTTSLLKWISLAPKTGNSIDIIHDIYFHDFGKTSSDYRDIDLAYFNSLTNLLAKIFNLKSGYSRVIIMSDHGPRTGQFGKLEPSQTIVKNSMKHKDYYSFFYAIFRLDSFDKFEQLPLGYAGKGKLYQINRYTQPMEVFLAD